MNIKKYYKTYRVLPPDYFYFENAGDGENTLSFYQSGTGTNFNKTIYYSFDAIDWQLLGRLNTTTLSDSPLQINHTGKIFLRAASAYIGWGNYNAYTIINSTNNVKAGGNIMSLLYGENFENRTSISSFSYGFYKFFKGLGSKLLSVNNLSLPATTLAIACYEGMFNGCSALTTAPELPATTLANGCYREMFNGCSSLTTAPTLPATKMYATCYREMFNGCSSLTTAPEILPATTLNGECYAYMFQSCFSLTTAPELPATTLAKGCYQGMFNGCSALTTAPELPATTLANQCYYDMFYGCTSLTTAPELPATTLNNLYCYENMFQGCSKLNYIKAYFLTAPSTTYLSDWVYKVAPTGTFVKNPAATWENTFGTSAIPTGWTVVTE